MNRNVVATLTAAVLALGTLHAAAQTITLTVDTTNTGAKIDRNIFGQFAENLGRGLYGGIWVGKDSKIPNTRGIRKDVVEALRELKVPNVRWPGGCFADEYHWRKGVGPADKRPATVNGTWGNVVDTNAFGTDEFMDFIQQIGSEPYVSVNVGSGTPQEAADWVEYMTAEVPTALEKERAANGHPAPYHVGFLGIGNESWACGGNMTVDYYLSQLKIYSHFVRNFNPAQKEKPMMRIAVGPGFATTEWTEAIMKAQVDHGWSWGIEGLSIHWYTMEGWPPTTPSMNFGVESYDKFLKQTYKMDEMVRMQAAVMDKYDPEKKVALAVDEWGGWEAPLPGTNHDFLEQQNSLRDAILAAINLNIFARHADRVHMANIAQMINVLQAMIVTDGEKMVRTPTYYVFKMYVPFQDATLLPVTLDAGTYAHGDVTLPRVDAIAARDANGKLWLAITNLDPEKPAEIDAAVTGLAAKSAKGETLTAAAVDSINTFDKPSTVMPKPIAATAANGKLTLKLEPKSVTVIAVE